MTSPGPVFPQQQPHRDSPPRLARAARNMQSPIPISIRTGTAIQRMDATSDISMTSLPPGRRPLPASNSFPYGRGADGKGYGGGSPGGNLVLLFINTVAFERRCIRSSFVALLAAYSTVRLKERASLAGSRSPEGSAAEAKRMRRQTAKDDRARRRRTGGTPSRAQGVRQRAGGADRAAGAGRSGSCLFCCDKRSPGCVGRARPSLVRRTGSTPPRSLLRLAASPRVSLVSRRNHPGVGSLTPMRRQRSHLDGAPTESRSRPSMASGVGTPTSPRRGRELPSRSGPGRGRAGISPKGAPHSRRGAGRG